MPRFYLAAWGFLAGALFGTGKAYFEGHLNRAIASACCVGIGIILVVLTREPKGLRDGG